jgi:hypothetical protein
MPRQAIVCKFLPPTERLDARIRCTAQAGSRTLPWDDAADQDANFERAATTFALDLGWLGTHPRHSRLVAGTLPDGSHVFVLQQHRNNQRGGR